MPFFILYLWIMTLVHVQSFRTPLPYGTGFQSTTDNDKLSDKGIFHLFGNIFKYALSTNDPPLESKTEGKDFEIIVKVELYDILSIGGVLFNFFGSLKSGKKLRCRPGSGWPGCYFLFRI